MTTSEQGLEMLNGLQSVSVVLLLFMFSCCASGVDSDFPDRLDFQVLLGQCCCLSTAWTVMRICTNTHYVCVCVCVCVCMCVFEAAHKFTHTCTCTYTDAYARTQPRMHAACTHSMVKTTQDHGCSDIQSHGVLSAILIPSPCLIVKPHHQLFGSSLNSWLHSFFFSWIVALNDTAALTMMSKVFSLFFFLRRVPSHCWENIPISGCMVFVSSGASMQKLEVCDFPRPALGKADQIYGLLWWSLASTSAQRQMVRRDSHCNGMALCIVRQDKRQHH